MRDQENAIKDMMENKHPEATLAAIDPHFLNPFADPQLVARSGADAA